MNPDGTFCLGLRAGDALSNLEKATAWWTKLSVFLTCQETAFETRVWPPKIEISHGQAGETEVHAEEEAERLGMLADYQLAVRENRGPISDAVKKIRKSSGRLKNGRAACVCGRKIKDEKPMLRRQCWAEQLACLPLLEAKRRSQEKRFWKEIIGKHRCCETMDDCPLAGATFDEADES